MATLLDDLPKTPPPLPKLNTVLAGRYEIQEAIGRGSYGHVFRARHLGTGQDVALKVLEMDQRDPQFAVRRFFLEARVTSGLRHPHTVRVFDFGQENSGLVFLAMELLTGRTLRQEIMRRKVAGQKFIESEIIDIGVAVTKSLSEAHEATLVHRDLKPDNIFLHQVPGVESVVKVLDFGIAKLGIGSPLTLSSKTGVPGTPAYMAPESALNANVDRRSDVYALGVVLYQLLTFELPYDAESDPAVLYQHVHAEIPDPRVTTSVSDGLAEVVMKALAKRPDDRYPDARAMRDALLQVGRQTSEAWLAPWVLGADGDSKRSKKLLPQPSLHAERPWMDMAVRAFGMLVLLAALSLGISLGLQLGGSSREARASPAVVKTSRSDPSVASIPPTAMTTPPDKVNGGKARHRPRRSKLNRATTKRRKRQ